MQGKFGVTFVMEKVVFWNARSPVIKSIFLFGCTTCGLVSWDWLRGRVQIKRVITGRDRHAGEKKKMVLFTGSHRMPVAAGTQGRCRGDPAALGGSCCRLSMFVGKTWPTQSEEECESKRGCSRVQTTWIRGASKADLTESIWTTVNSRQSVCWVTLASIFTGSLPTNTCYPARLSESASDWGFSTKLRDFFHTLPSENRK